MHIVIEIPDGYVKVIMANQRTEGSAMDKLIRQAVIDGTPLPKGHGRLKDVDDLDVTTIETDDYDGNEVLDVVLKEDIDEAPTIVEADREKQTKKKARNKDKE